ncbi:MAG: sialidase family protein [Victivallales bacterium]
MDPHTITTIYSDGKYLGWPTMTRSPQTGRIFVVFSGGRRGHICPFGKVMMISSDDDGRTWSGARILYDGPLDDRDAGVLVTSKGTVLVSWFNSIIYRYFLEKDDWSAQNLTPAERLEWQGISNNISDECLSQELGNWMIRSEDGGRSFSAKIPTMTNSSHGPTELADGRLLYVGKFRSEIKRYSDLRMGSPHGVKNGVAESIDDGRSWRILCGELPVAEGDLAADYYEYYAVQASDGKLVAHIRNRRLNSRGQAEILQMESSDEGRSWTTPHSTGTYGGPVHLMRLGDGRLLMSYSHRYEPMGNYAKVSKDCGLTWSAPFVFGPTRQADMGYPSSVELPDGTMLSAWYEHIPGRNEAVLRMARWKF